MTLTEKERAILRYALKSLISAFPEKSEFNAEDWPAEQKEQAATRQLLQKLGGKP